MEKFTNDNIEFFDQIIKELHNFSFNKNWEIQFQYVEVPYLLRYGFSFCVLKTKQKIKFIQRTWNSKYDRERFSLGIFNIDRLAVTQKEILLKPDDVEFFDTIDLSKLNSVEYGGIVIDGFFCEIKIPKYDKKFDWNIDEEMNEELKILINKVRNLLAES